MSLTTAQLQAFKTAITTDANVATALASGDHGAICTYYNGGSGVNVWRPSITVSELNTAIVWGDFIALSVQVQNGYFALTQGGTVDATSANVRAGFSSIFGAASTSLTNLTNLARRTATRFENLFATGNVTTVFGYVVAPADVAQALAS